MRLSHHKPVWDKILCAIENNRLPQAFLFLGSRQEDVLCFVDQLIKVLCCQTTPCGFCRTCMALTERSHPDRLDIVTEATGAAIKIDEIRALQQKVYQTPQWDGRQFIVIAPADRLTISAANALLKVLEEPPHHTLFILIASHLEPIPATILSRCQVYSIPDDPSFECLRGAYPEGSSRAAIIKDYSHLLSELGELVAGRYSPCLLAARWGSYAFDDMIWMLYWVTAKAIRERALTHHLSESIALHRLSSPELFDQLREITSIMRTMHHAVSMNQTLVLEKLLLGYIRK